MVITSILAVLAATCSASAAIVATKSASAPATTTTVTCTVLGCPPSDLKGDGLFSMDQSDFTDTLTCLWRFPLQPIVEGDYNLTTGLLIRGDPTEVPAAALTECVTSTINGPVATAR